MPRGRGAFAGSAAEAERALLRAAEACFAEWGVRRTTMEDVACTAGVSRATVYRYFRDRDALVLAVIARRTRAFSGPAREFLAARESFADQVVDGVTMLIEAGRADPIMHALLRPDAPGSGREVITSSQLARDIAAEVWAPIFRRAQRSGQMRADLDISETCAWIASVELLVLGWEEVYGLPPDGVRGLVRRFVLPALVAHT
ncbi:MAG: TetR/AcrR family transcriptional regulator [Sporichthyaceae bacterium]